MKVYNKQNSLQELVDNDPFQESVLIKYSFSENENEFTWIGTCLNWNLPKGHGEFIKLVFKEVSNYKHNFPNDFPNNRFLNAVNNFYCKNYSGTYESEMSEVSSLTSNSNKIVITLPYLLGNIDFNFEYVILYSKIGKGKKININEWQYFDIDTSLLFDFYEPFEGN